MALRFVVIAAVGAFAIAPDAHSSTSSKAIRSDKKATQIVSPNGMVSEEHVGPASLVDKSHGEVAETQDHHKASDDQKEQNSKLSRGTNILSLREPDVSTFDWGSIQDWYIWAAAGGLLGVTLLVGFVLGAPAREASGLKRGLTLGESVISGNSRKASVDGIMRSLSSQIQDTSGLCCGVRFTENMRVLALTAGLFALITAVQFVAAGGAGFDKVLGVPKSDALLADCVSMAVDSLTYLLNIFVEAREGSRFHRELQLIVPAISLSILVYFTVDVLLEAKGTLAGEEDDEGDPYANQPMKRAYILGGFATLGIIFDLIALRAFVKDADKGSLNMWAAFAHVGADFVRSITTLVAAILILNGSDGKLTDAWACVAVTWLIFGGVLFAVYEWAKDFRSYIAK